MATLDMFLQDREVLFQDHTLVSPKILAGCATLRRDFGYLFAGPPATRKIIKKQVGKFEKQTARPDHLKQLKTAGESEKAEKELNASYNKLTAQNAAKLCPVIVDIYRKHRGEGGLHGALLELFWKHMTEQAPANQPAYVSLLRMMISEFPETDGWVSERWGKACQPAYYSGMPVEASYDEFCEYRAWRKRHLHEVLFWISWKVGTAAAMAELAGVLEQAATVTEDPSHADSLVEWLLEIFKRFPKMVPKDASLRKKTSGMSSKIKFRWMELDDVRQKPSAGRRS